MSVSNLLTTETVFFICLTPGIQSHLHLQLQCCTCLPHSHIYYGLLPLTVIPLLSGAYFHLSMLCSTLFLLSLQILMLSANILILCRSICLSPLQTSRGSQVIPSVIPPQSWIHLAPPQHHCLAVLMSWTPLTYSWLLHRLPQFLSWHPDFCTSTKTQCNSIWSSLDFTINKDLWRSLRHWLSPVC